MGTIIKILLLLFVSVLIGAGGVTGCSKNETDSANKATSRLVRAQSLDNLADQVKSSLVRKHGTFHTQKRSEFGLAGKSSSSLSYFSRTTVQHDNIDEADRLKTDGKHIYISKIGTVGIKVFNVDAGNAVTISELALPTRDKDSQLSGLYLREDGKQLIALASDGEQARHRTPSRFLGHPENYQKTDVITVDISTPTTPKQVSQVILDGQLISSRRIGSTLYVVTRHTAVINGLIEDPNNVFEAALNRALITKTSMDELLPKYEINHKRQALFDAQDCFYTSNKQSNHSQHSIISLLAIDLNKTELKPKGQCFIGNTETVYASAKAIYLATTQYNYTDASSDLLIYEGTPTTEIHKFSLEATQPNYVGSASINGHLGWQQSQKPWRLSEENGLLRVLSYVGEKADSLKSPARLHVLKESAMGGSLEIIATLPNERRSKPLGKKGELIYASRFIGNRGYLVTFKSTDPLYILDLSNPTDPYILSALEIEGYSDHLHPVGENFLLGIGKGAIAQTQDNPMPGPARGAWYQGVKLSLIDISNPAKPVEKQKIILGKRGTNTAVSKSHHALSTLLKGNTMQVNLPVSLHETNNENLSSDLHPSAYFSWTRDALYRLNIDIKSGGISMLKPINAAKKKMPEFTNYLSGSGWQYDRSAIINGDAYYLKGNEIFTSTD